MEEKNFLHKSKIKSDHRLKKDKQFNYIYKKGNKYYIQQPYNGIYQITKDEYIIVKKIIE